MDSALELHDINKAFGATRAIDGLSLVVPRGATYGLIGPSGAGKTTAIRMIMSILLPDSGSLRVLGQASALAATLACSAVWVRAGAAKNVRGADRKSAKENARNLMSGVLLSGYRDDAPEISPAS